MLMAREELEKVIQFCYAELAEARTANNDLDIPAVEQRFRKIYNKLGKTIQPQNAEPNENP